MGKTNIFWKMVSKSYTVVSNNENPNNKLVKYSCNFCLHQYAYNVTRMAGHLLTDCATCPSDIKKEIYKFHRTINKSESGILGISGPEVSSQKLPTNNKKLSDSVVIRRVNSRWVYVSKHYSKLPAEESDGGKIEKYMCNYCSQRYACNVTRMSQHILNCSVCPPSVKSEFFEISAYNSSAFTFQNSDNKGDEENNTMILQIHNSDTSTSTQENSGETIIQKIENENDNSNDNEEISENMQIEENSPLTNSEKDTWSLFARACFTTGISAQLFEDVHWQIFLQNICPGIKLPSQELLSNDYLNSEYSNIFSIVQEKVKNAKALGLQIHGLHKKKYESAIIIMFTTPEPVVYKIVDAKTIRHNPNNLFQIIAQIINETGPDRIISLVTDYVLISWKKLQVQVPNSPVCCYGCNLNILYLLVGDILKIFKPALSHCRAIIKQLKNYPNIVPLFFNTGEHNTNLIFPSKNWEKTKACLKSFMKNKQALRAVAESKDKEYLHINSRKSILGENNFWPNVLFLHDLLKHISVWMKQMKKKSPCISSTVRCYYDLNNKFKETFIDLKVPENQSTEILKCLHTYKKLAVQDIQKAAYLLNPHFVGKKLTDEDIIDAVAFINKLGRTLPRISADMIRLDVAAYRSKQGFWAKELVWDYLKRSDGSLLPPIIWWQSKCGSTELSKIAIEILRSSATLVDIGDLSDLNSRMKCRSEKVQKLIYVRHNLKLLKHYEEEDNNLEENQEETDFSDTDSSDSSSDSEIE